MVGGWISLGLPSGVTVVAVWLKAMMPSITRSSTTGSVRICSIMSLIAWLSSATSPLMEEDLSTIR